MSIFNPVQSFRTLEDAFEHIRRVQLWNDLQIQDWQRELKAGDCCARAWRMGSGRIVTLYLEILPLDPEDGPLDPSYRFVRGHSILCPEGELGTEHIANFDARIERELFETAKKLGWPDLFTA